MTSHPATHSRRAEFLRLPVIRLVCEQSDNEARRGRHGRAAAGAALPEPGAVWLWWSYFCPPGPSKARRRTAALSAAWSPARRRRTDLVGISPDRAATIRLVELHVDRRLSLLLEAYGLLDHWPGQMQLTLPVRPGMGAGAVEVCLCRDVESP
jgi:hypothetical protein